MCMKLQVWGFFNKHITFSEYERVEMNGWLIYIGLKKDLAAINTKFKKKYLKSVTRKTNPWAGQELSVTARKSKHNPSSQVSLEGTLKDFCSTTCNA